MTTTPVSRINRDSTLDTARLKTTTRTKIKNSSDTMGNSWSSWSKSPTKQFRSRPVGVVSKKLAGLPATCGDQGACPERGRRTHRGAGRLESPPRLQQGALQPTRSDLPAPAGGCLCAPLHPCDALGQAKTRETAHGLVAARCGRWGGKSRWAGGGGT